MDTDEKIEAMFDGISYDKGGSVLRMLRAYLERNTDPQPLLRRSLLQVQSLPYCTDHNTEHRHACRSISQATCMS